MIRSTKNIFTVIGLTLLCVPALHGNDTQQQSLDKDTLKQFIANIPHIYNPDASVFKFKTDYAKFMQLEMTPKEKIDACLEFITTAQEIKEHVQAKINDLESKKLDKRKLAKGIACITGSLIVLGILNHNFNPFPYEMLSPEAWMATGLLIADIGCLWGSTLLCRDSFYPNHDLKTHFKMCCNALDEIIMHLQTNSYF